MDTCIIKDCGRTPKTRGLCHACYSAATKAIKTGQVPSWDFLIENGLALAAMQSSAPSPFAQRLAEIKKEKGNQKASEITHGGNQ